jgi:SpoVK/Ycf46/Vps4 family AAA+-type ATPase
MKDINYTVFVKTGTDYRAISAAETVPCLSPGMYTIKINRMTGSITFQLSTLTHDNLVDLPNPVYTHIVKEMGMFMEDEVKKAFETEGFIYKRSTLLYGAPGTGKTCVVNRIIGQVIAKNGIVLFNPPVLAMAEIFKILNSIQPEVLTMVVFEEFDETVSEYENELLSILDGQVQKKNMIIMATTNYINKIPKRIQRPGRFSTVIEMGMPTKKEREFYLDKKLKTNRHLIPEIVEMTKGFSIDEVKETVLAHVCLKQPLPEIVARINKMKKEVDNTQLYNSFDDLRQKNRRSISLFEENEENNDHLD